MIRSLRGDRMFDILLEKQDKIIFRLFQYLQKNNPCSLKKAANQLNLKPKSLKRYITLWQQEGSNFSTGISFYIKDQMIRAIYSQESAQLFLSVLLNRSFSFQLLVKILEQPFCTFKSLENKFYISKATMQRRIQKMKPLLQHYGLSISFVTAPILTGNEIQLRYFSLLVSLLYDPPLLWNSQVLFDRYEETQQYRIGQGFKLKKTKPAITNPYYPIPFQIDDTSLLFLWRQFSGLETIWLDSSLTESINFALHAYTNLSELSIITLAQKLHRLHSLCSFYSGSLFVAYDPFFIMKNSERLIQSFTKLLPHYQQLLAKHPELPCFYESLLQHDLHNKNSEQIISED